MFDNIFVQAVAGILGIVVLIYSAEYVVKKLVALAHHYGVSNTFMGLTVLSIGTSLPEIGSHLAASIGILSGTLDYKIASSTVLGANIGSDVIQQTLIVGLVILIAGGMTFTKSFLKKSYSVMILTTLMCLILGWDGVYSRWDGAILFGSFLAYMYYLYKDEQDEAHSHVHARKKHKVHSPKKDIFAVLGGMAVLLVSSTVVLRVVEQVVHQTNVGGSLIGVLSLGIASALPEFITAISGIRQKAQGISLGTLIGSNITNPLVAIGLGALVSTYFVPRPLVLWDLPMETITAALLVLWLLMHKRKLGKGGAFYLIALYIVYVAVRIIFFSVD